MPMGLARGGGTRMMPRATVWRQAESDPWPWPPHAARPGMTPFLFAIAVPKGRGCVKQGREKMQVVRTVGTRLSSRFTFLHCSVRASRHLPFHGVRPCKADAAACRARRERQGAGHGTDGAVRPQGGQGGVGGARQPPTTGGIRPFHHPELEPGPGRCAWPRATGRFQWAWRGSRSCLRPESVPGRPAWRGRSVPPPVPTAVWR